MMSSVNIDDNMSPSLHIDSSEIDRSSSRDNDQSTSEIIEHCKIGGLRVGKSDDFHLGTQVVIEGEVCIKNLQRQDIINVNDTCKSCQLKKSESGFRGKLRNIKNIFTVKHMLLLAATIIFVQVIILYNQYLTTIVKESRRFIDQLKITNFHNNLENFVARSNWSRMSEYYGDDDKNCTYQCSQIKLKIRFVVMKSLLLHCLTFAQLCSREMKFELYRFRYNDPNPYSDLYYNYVISAEWKKEIYEGRSLTCPFDETFLEEDHASIITVGIGYCFTGTSEINANYTVTQSDLIRDFITNLRENGILGENFVLEFPDTCKNSLLLKRITPDIGRILLYNNDRFVKLNISTSLNSKIIRKFLFLTDETTESDTKYHPNITFPFSSKNSTDNFAFKLTHVGVVTVRLYAFSWYDDIYPPRSCNVPEIFVQKCWPILIKKLFKGDSYEKQLNNSIGNYYLFTEMDVAYGEIPSRHTQNLKSGDMIINIFLIDSHIGPNRNYGGTMIRFHELFELVVNHVRGRITYSKFEFQFACNNWLKSNGDLHMMYKYTVDLRYVDDWGLIKPRCRLYN